MVLLTLVGAIFGFIVMAVRSSSRGPNERLSARERAELEEACLKLGIPGDEVATLVDQKNDVALTERYRLEHRRLAARTSVFR
jgi:hypothetical protein